MQDKVTTDTAMKVGCVPAAISSQSKLISKNKFGITKSQRVKCNLRLYSSLSNAKAKDEGPTRPFSSHELGPFLTHFG